MSPVWAAGIHTWTIPTAWQADDWGAGLEAEWGSLPSTPSPRCERCRTDENHVCPAPLVQVSTQTLISSPSWFFPQGWYRPTSPLDKTIKQPKRGLETDSLDHQSPIHKNHSPSQGGRSPAVSPAGVRQEAHGCHSPCLWLLDFDTGDVRLPVLSLLGLPRPALLPPVQFLTSRKPKWPRW